MEKGGGLNVTYDVISTGSKNGNAVFFNDKILIDVGVPKKRIADKENSLSLVLLTHEHS